MCALAAPNLSEAMQTYLQLKGAERPKTFRIAAMRNAQAVMDILGDRPISQYSTVDAGRVRDALFGRGLAVLSVRRSFTTIKAIINLTIAEHGLDIHNPFSATYMPEADSKKRVSIPVETIRQIQRSCMEHDDEMRWLVALISDTGMRLAEAAGLNVNDIKLHEDTLYVDIRPHSWRSLKTKGSQRCIPLVGLALWACERLRETNDSSSLAFPR